MSNFLVVTSEISDAAAAITVTATPSTAAPAENLLKMQPLDFCQVPYQVSYWTANVVINFGGPVDINFVGLLYTNFGDNATWRIRLADTEANLTAAPSYDVANYFYHTSDVSFDKKHGFMYFSTTETCTWMRIDFGNHEDTAEGFFNWGRLIAGLAKQPLNNFNYGNTRGFIDNSTQDVTIRGNTIVNEQGLQKTLKIVVTADSEDEMYDIGYRVFQTRGSSKDVLIILDPDDEVHRNDKIYYGLLNANLPIVNPDFDQYEQTFELKELI